MLTLRSRLTFANVTSVIALFIALGGSATAAILITGKNVKNGSLTGADVKTNSLGTKQIMNGDLLAEDFKAGQFPAGAQGLQGPPGANGTNGTNGTNGADGAAGPSDIYLEGIMGSALTTTMPRTIVASITVPPGSYMLGANLFVTAGALDTRINCHLQAPGAGTLWDYQLMDLPASKAGSMSLASAATFTTNQGVELACNGSNASTAVDGRVWAIKTGNLHATLPVPHD
jgi:hypothetical protein